MRMESVMSKKALFVAVVLLGQGFGLACSDKVNDISSEQAMEGIVGRCIEVMESSFLLRVRSDLKNSEEVRRYLLLPPGVLVAPQSIDHYLRGDEEFSELVEVVRIIEEGERLVAARALSIVSFEGSYLALIASVRNEDGEQVDVAVEALLNDLWSLNLSDGKLEAYEKAELKGIPILNPRWARFCEEKREEVPEGSGDQTEPTVT